MRNLDFRTQALAGKETKMERIELKPQREQMTMWFIGWTVPTIMGLILWLSLLVYIPASEVPKFVWVLCLIGWAILTGLIAIWIPAFYKSLRYVVESDCVKMAKGVFWKKNVTVPFTKITNVDVTQGPLQRMFDIGTIKVQTAGAGGAQGARPELVLVGMRDLEGLKETIMERVRGYEPSKSADVRQKVSEDSETEVLSRMLQELIAIRELLEEKSS